MKIQTKSKIACIATVLSLGTLAYGACNSSRLGGSHWEQELSDHPAYIESERMHTAAENLQTAGFRLVYRPAFTERVDPVVIVLGEGFYNVNMPEFIENPAEYPDAKQAREHISVALENMGDIGSLDERLRMVYDSLPNEDNASEYNGTPVNTDTFEPQSKELRSIMYAVTDRDEAAWDKVLQEKKERKIGYNIMAILGLLGFSASCLLSSKYLRQTDKEQQEEE